MLVLFHLLECRGAVTLSVAGLARLEVGLALSVEDQASMGGGENRYETA